MAFFAGGLRWKLIGVENTIVQAAKCERIQNLDSCSTLGDKTCQHLTLVPGYRL